MASTAQVFQPSEVENTFTPQLAGDVVQRYVLQATNLLDEESSRAKRPRMV